MTAEIALLNKSAVALAADSAVSIQTADGIKVYNSMNKLFALSKYAPVGIMVYGTAQIVGTPWETIIKLYREYIGEDRLATISDYSRSFLDYIQNNSTQLFTEDEQRESMTGKIFYFCHGLHHEALEEMEPLLDKNGDIPKAQVRGIYNALIKRTYDILVEFEDIPGLDEKFAEEVFLKYEKEVLRVIDASFEPHKITKSQRDKLVTIAKLILHKAIFVPGLSSGIVISGFGEDEIFPALESFEMDGVTMNRLRYRPYADGKVTHETTAVVLSFAQAEEVQAFMNGVHRDLLERVDSMLQEFVDRYPDIICSSMSSVTRDYRRQMLNKMKVFSTKVLQDMRADVTRFMRENYSDPVLEAVQFLPRDELASMAESLVSLTSFKQRVSLNSETVGGPVDVAVISKGDGLIWMKRKHYFQPELNQQFFANYYRRSPTRSPEGGLDA